MTFRRTVRAGLRRARQWLQEPEVISDVGYYRINYLVRELLAQEEGWRPHFLWGVVNAAWLGKQLGLAKITAIEFGVAGGDGLVDLEGVASVVTERLQIGIDVYGFDSGAGLPPPQDYRDLPNLYQSGGFPMDQDALRRRLQHAHLILGPVVETVAPFIASAPAPVGFISFDLDYYSSTMEAFRLFDGNSSALMPRVHCYFDDIMGFTFSEFTGERLAIAEFNGSHATRKISPIYGLRYYLPPPHDRSQWVESMYLAHLFDHPRYGEYDGLASVGRSALSMGQRDQSR